MLQQGCADEDGFAGNFNACAGEKSRPALVSLRNEMNSLLIL